MILTDFEKIIVNEINKGNVNDPLTYREWMLRNESDRAIQENNTEFNRYMITFLQTVKRLEESNLLMLSPVFDNLPFKNKFLERLIPNNNMYASNDYLAMIRSFRYEATAYSIRIYPMPELTSFIERGYMTKDEVKYLEEVRARKNANRLTIIIALASLIGSALFSFLPWWMDRDKVEDVNVKTIQGVESYIETIKNIEENTK
jgi:hypothetical protein